VLSLEANESLEGNTMQSSVIHAFFVVYRPSAQLLHPVDGAIYPPMAGEEECALRAGSPGDESGGLCNVGQVRIKDFSPGHEGRLCLLLDHGLVCYNDVDHTSTDVGEGVSAAERDISVVLPPLALGLHSLSVMLLDLDGKVLFLTTAVSFEVAEVAVSGIKSDVVRPICFSDMKHDETAVVYAERWTSNLGLQEWSIFSLNGEDGVLASIFSRIGAGTAEHLPISLLERRGGRAVKPFYVEMCTDCSAGVGNIALLREHYGWAGVQLGSHSVDGQQ
jgi:hypothetical protein